MITWEGVQNIARAQPSFLQPTDNIEIMLFSDFWWKTMKMLIFWHITFLQNKALLGKGRIFFNGIRRQNVFDIRNFVKIYQKFATWKEMDWQTEKFRSAQKLIRLIKHGSNSNPSGLLPPSAINLIYLLFLLLLHVCKTTTDDLQC